MHTPHFFAGLAQATMALFIILDPVGLLPVVAALTTGMERNARQRMLYTSAFVAWGLLLVLTFTAKAVFKLYAIQMADFKIAGGVILFLVALHTIDQRHWDEGFSGRDAGIVPIACPLLIGPGAIAISLITLDQYGFPITALSVTVAFLLIFLIFRFTESLFRLLGETGAGVVARLAGMLLAAIAVQFIRVGMLDIIRHIR
ncbi:MAG TPA: MarC family protein [Armatimonadota bacterium]|jgi:multiple antibiotic resistance protein